MDIKNILSKLEGLDSRVYDGMGLLSQFSIDAVENARDKVQGIVDGINENSPEDVIGSLSYKCSIALEVMDKNLPDYSVIGELNDILNER